MIKVACIPAYNEERTIGKVVVRAQDYVDEVLVCDDHRLRLRYKAREEARAKPCRYGGWRSSAISMGNYAVGKSRSDVDCAECEDAVFLAAR